MIDTNQFLIDFVGDNWMALTIFYGMLKAMFPDSRILAAMGEGLSKFFPVLTRPKL